MKKIQITEEDFPEREWLEEARKQTSETLPKFIGHLMNDYEHDYGTCVKAVSAAMLGTFWAFNRQEGFSSFQVGFIPWLLMKEFWGNSEFGRRVINYDDMLFPQCEYKFEKTISKDLFKKLQEKASKLLKEEELYPDVKAHLESIVSGNVPFGYTIKESD